MADVEYREIPGFIGYRAGSDGTIWSCWSRGAHPKVTDIWKLLKPFPQRGGYLIVSLFVNRVAKKELVHRLVLFAFVGPCPEGMECCHDPDPDRKNCAISNLRWDTRKNNHKDRMQSGIVLSGEQHPLAKLNWSLVEKARELSRNGMSLRKIASEIEVHHMTIANIVNNRTWKKK